MGAHVILILMTQPNEYLFGDNMCFTHINKLTLAVLSISTSIQVFSLNCVSCSEWHNNEIAQNNNIV